ITVAASIAAGASANWGPVTCTTNELTFTNQAVAQAASAPGGLRTVTDTITGVSCQGAVNSQIGISKTCDPGATLVDIGDNVAVQVGVSGTVTNNGNTSLSGITLADNPTATITFDGSTPLPPGQSRPWSATYQPAALPSGGPPFNFGDIIRVTAATPAIGDPLPAATGCPDPNDLACAGASCPLCPTP